MRPLRDAFCAAVCFALFAGPAAAQDWARVEVCTVDKIALHADAVAPASLDALIATGAATPNGTGNFWRIKAPGGGVSHLWGTMHSTDPLILALPDAVMAEIEAARIVAVELDPVYSSRAEIQKANLYEGYFRPSLIKTSALKRHINPDVLNWIRLRAEALQWGTGAPEMLTAAAVAEILLYDPCDDFASGTYPGQDSYIQLRGVLTGAQVLGLERPTEVFEYLNAPQNEALAYDMINVYGATLQPQPNSDARATAYALYQQGRNGAAIAWDRAYVGGVLGLPDGPKAVDRVNAYLLDQRNLRFLDTARANLNTGGVFMAIGAWHLPGTGGMVAQLRGAGFDVARVPLPLEMPE